MRMERARRGALRRMTTSGITACILLGAGAGSARAALAGSVTDVPCNVSALVATMGTVTAGETLNLAAGCVYHLTQAPPDVSQDLTIDGNGAMIERSYASGTPAFTILTIAGGTVTINDLEIRHGDNGITLSGPNATLTVNDSSFVNNQGSDGGAISVPKSANDGPVVSDSVFMDNKATDAGGAIYNNSAGDGVTVTGSTFLGNVAAGDGGAIYDFCGIGEHLTDSLVEDNKASEGGGIWFSPDGSMVLNEDTISHNDATGNGGGIAAVEFNTLQLQNSTITGNRAADGGGLDAELGNYEHITGSDFTDNIAHDGGGIFNNIIAIATTLSDTKIADNHAGADGGGFYYDSTTDPSGETWSATGSQITSNVAGSAGGGIFNTENATGTLTNSQVHGNEPTNCAPPGSVTGCTG
jgi:predicted outer membrane repeat protein